MGLSSDLISQFVKATNDKPEPKTETTCYGTTVEDNGKTYVRLDGSELLTPVSTTADTKPGERVTVMIKNHRAVIMGNMSSPAARTEDVKNVTNDTAENATKISEFEIVLAKKVDTEELNAESARIDTLVSENVTIKQNIASNSANIETLSADTVEINESLSAANADIAKLKTDKLDASIAEITYATITGLETTDAKIVNLEATYGDFADLTADKIEAMEAEIAKLEAGEITVDQLKATFATIVQLDAEKARIDNLEAEVGDIDTLIFGSATGNVIQTSFANAVIAQLGNAQIKSAMIESITADKITSGDVITNNVNVKSEDGKLLISDETIQISDDTRVRVQIGKDAEGDYSINIWDANGNLMFSEGGITDSAIKDAIIRNDMVSDTANIAAHKLDIDSLFEEINGSTNTIKSTRVLLDDQNQTLDVAFTELTTEVTDLGETVTSQGTAISTMQGQISSKIWQQDIDTATSSLSDQYTSVEQTLESLSATVADHTSAIDKKADSTTVTEVSNKVSSLELTVDQFQSSVSNTYATKTELESVNSDVAAVESKLSSTETKISQNESSIASLVSRTEVIESTYSTTENVSSAIEQKADSIMSSVSSTYATLTKLNETNAAVSSAQSDIDNLTIGGRNLLLGTKFDGEAKRYERLETYGTEGGFHFDTSEQIESGVEYVLSLSMRGNANIVFYEINTSGGNFAHFWIRRAQLSEEEFRDFYITFSVDTSRIFGNVYICTQYGEEATAVGDWFEIESCSLKLERGNRKTDWTPAPEDMATDGDVTAVQISVESVEERVTTAESMMQQLSDAIMMLVTDENGETLMIQTDTGWTYNMSQLQGVVNSTSESLDTLVNEVGDINSTVGILQQAVDDLGVLNEYVKITTYEDEPCIELGESDSEYKLLITNTRILFMEDGVTPAYITNQSLNIEKAVIEEELQQGGFVWKVRSNGNLGLMWKGVDE